MRGERVLSPGTKSDSYYSRSVRPIDNGVIICESKDGKYSERYAPSDPTSKGKPNGPGETGSSLAEAAAFLKGR